MELDYSRVVLDRSDARRRWYGVFFLVAALAMLTWGETFFKPWLRGLMFVAYWSVCFGFTGLAIVVALLDLVQVRRRVREQQRSMLERALSEVERAAEERKDVNDSTVP
jgi:hypothetical protein